MMAMILSTYVCAHTSTLLHFPFDSLGCGFSPAQKNLRLENHDWITDRLDSAYGNAARNYTASTAGGEVSEA